MPYVNFYPGSPGQAVAITQRQLAFIVVNTLMGNTVRGGTGLHKALLKLQGPEHRHLHDVSLGRSLPRTFIWRSRLSVGRVQPAARERRVEGPFEQQDPQCTQFGEHGRLHAIHGLGLHDGRHSLSSFD